MPSLRVNGYDMAFVERGAGVPLLLVHGTASDYRLWAEQMEPFGASYRTIAVSLRHCWPERWNGEGEGFTTRQHISDVTAFIIALGLGPVHLLGLSRGGHIAFRVAQNRPDLIRALVLVEPGGVLDSTLEPAQPPITSPIAFGPLYAEMAERIRRGEIDKGLEPAIDVMTLPGWWRRVPERVRQMFRDNAITLLGQFKDQRAPYARADAEAIHAPTLLVVGQRSQETFRRTVDGLLSGLRDARIAIIPDASHASNIDNPREFAREVLAFLDTQIPASIS